MITAPADSLYRPAFAVVQPRPDIQRLEIINEIGVRQGCAFGHPGGSAGVDDQRQVVGWIDSRRRRGGLGAADHVVEHQMPGGVTLGMGDLAQQTAQKTLQPGQIGFYVADDHRFHIGALDGLFGGGVELGVVHAEQHLGPGILELVIEFCRGVQGVAGHTNRACLEDAEEDGRVVRQVGQENGHAVALFDALCMQKIGDPVGRILDLGEGAGCVVEDGVGPVRIVPCRVVQQLKKGLVVSVDFVGNTVGPVFGGPMGCCHCVISCGWW